MKINAVMLSAMMLAAVLCGSASAMDGEYELVIKDHHFSPPSLAVPAGKKFKLVVKNEDATAEEFESYDLNREKVVAGRSQITVFLGPLSAKTYKYFGDFHQDTAQGTLEAK